MRHFLFCLIISLVLAACTEKSDLHENPDEMTGREIIVGNWKWILTHEDGFDHIYHLSYDMTPETEYQTFSIEFTDMGIARFYKNEYMYSEIEIDFGIWSPDTSVLHDAYHFTISQYLFGYVNQDSLCLTNYNYSTYVGFPYTNYFGSTLQIDRINYFIRSL